MQTPSFRTARTLAVPALGLLTLAAPAVGPAAHAQSKTGTTVGQVLLLDPSARSAALGGTGVASADEVQALYYNPASLGHLATGGLQFTHLDYVAGVTFDHATTAVRLGDAATLALTVTYLNSGEMEQRTVEQPDGTGTRFRVSNLSAGVAVGRRFTERFSAGVQASYLRETIFNSSLGAVSFNAGVLYDLPVAGARLGASLSNFGTRGAYDGRDLRINYDPDPDVYGNNSALPAALRTEGYPLPILFRVGLSVPVLSTGDQRLTAFADAFQPSDNTNAASLGAEWSFRDLLFLRGGYDRLFEQDSETGLTAGGGLRVRVGRTRLSGDYSWGAHRRLGTQQRFTLGFAF